MPGSSSSCSSASTITSPPTTNSPSTSGPARCFSIAAIRGRGPTSNVHAVRIAERQRESEELLHTGVAAFQRGEGDEARRLLQAAIEGGAPPDEALAVLDRLNRLEPPVPVDSSTAHRTSGTHGYAVRAGSLQAFDRGRRRGYRADRTDRRRWLRCRTLGYTHRTIDRLAGTQCRQRHAHPSRGAGRDRRRRRRRWPCRCRARRRSSGRRTWPPAVICTTLWPRSNRFARPTRRKTEAERLRGDIQRQLLAAAPLPAAAQPDREKSDRRIP